MPSAASFDLASRLALCFGAAVRDRRRARRPGADERGIRDEAAGHARPRSRCASACGPGDVRRRRRRAARRTSRWTTHRTTAGGCRCSRDGRSIVAASSPPRVDGGPRHREPDDLEVLLRRPAQSRARSTIASIVADDDARRVSADAEALLDEWEAGAEFVPASLGGRWVSTEDLVRRWRPVFRRDPSLGLGYGLTTLMGAVNVWVAGDDRAAGGGRDPAPARRAHCRRLRRARPRRRLLQHESRRGAAVDGDLWLVSGVEAGDRQRRPGRVDAHHRADRAGGGRAQPLAPAVAPGCRNAAVRRHRRRVLTGGHARATARQAEFDELPVPADRTVGRARLRRAQTARTASQVTRAVLPALAVATVDSVARPRRPVRRRPVALRRFRARHPAVARAARRRDRGLPRSPTRSAPSWCAPCTSRPEDCLIPTAASEGTWCRSCSSSAMQDLSVLFGSTFYARVQPYDVFEKFLRDLAMLPIGHAGTDACLRTIDCRTSPAGSVRAPHRGHGPALVPPRRRRSARSRSIGSGRARSRATGDPLGAALRDPDGSVRVRHGRRQSEALDRLADRVRRRARRDRARPRRRSSARTRRPRRSPPCTGSRSCWPPGRWAACAPSGRTRR